MSPDSRRRNLEGELARAHAALRAATTLVPPGLYADAVSRAYYAVHHALRALLFTEGIEPKTHAGAIHLFNQHFVRVGHLPASTNRTLGGLQRARELADYDPAVVFDEETARFWVDEATSFLALVETWIAEHDPAA